MAQMRPAAFPATVNREARESREKDAYELLAKNLPADAIVLYEPTVFGRGGVRKYPDFILLHESFGVVVMEVKNWNLDRIAEANTNSVLRRLGDSGMKQPTPHPLKQARQYSFAIGESIARDLAKYPDLVNADGPHHGKTRFHVSCIVAFMGTKEADMERLTDAFARTLLPAEVLTEEALANPDLLLKQLRNIPKIFKGMPLRPEALGRIADNFIPPDASVSDRLRRDKEKRDKLLPKTVYDLSKPAAGEDELAVYNRLRRDLQGVAGDLHQLIMADREGGVRAGSVEKILEEVRLDEFRVGLFGETAAGKSTFINALFGRKLLPQRNGETTRTLTRIRMPGHRDQINRATITYKTLEEIDEETKAYLLADAGVDIDPDTFTIADAERMRQLCALVKTPPGPEVSYEMEAAHMFLDALVKGWGECRAKLGTTEDMDLDRSTVLCHREEAAVFIKSRDIYVDHPFSRDRFVFVDSPGVGSRLARHTALAEETARDVDAAAMIFNAKRPLMKADRDFIRRVRALRDPEAMDNYFFILNQISNLDPKELGVPDFNAAVSQQCDRLRERLREEGIAGAPVAPVEAQCALLAQLVTNREGCDPDTRAQWVDARYCLEDKKADFPDPEKNLKASRFPELVSLLKNHLSKVKIVGFLGTKHNHLRQVTDAFDADIKKEIDDLDRGIEDLERERSAHNKARANAEQKIDIHLKDAFTEKVDTITAEIEKRADALARCEITDLIREVVRKNVKKYFGKKTDSAKGFWEFVFRQSNIHETIADLVTIEQAKFQAEYRTLREKIQEQLTDDIIVKEYGDKIQWHINYQPISVYASRSLNAVNRLELGLWQSTSVFFRNLVGKIVPDWADIDNYITNCMSENYLASCAKEIRLSISGWLKVDCENFKRETKQSFERLMQAIDEGIAVRADTIGSKTSEREARSGDLQHYRREIDRTMEKLGSLKASIAKLNPR